MVDNYSALHVFERSSHTTQPPPPLPSPPPTPRFKRVGELFVREGAEGGLWVRRGAGFLKINKHRESGVYRILMRDDTDLTKVLINAVLDHRIVITPMSCVDSEKEAGWVRVYEYEYEYERMVRIR